MPMKSSNSGLRRSLSGNFLQLVKLSLSFVPSLLVEVPTVLVAANTEMKAEWKFCVVVDAYVWSSI